MEKKKNTNRFLTALSVSGLIALLLFSPCRVRNAIEDALNLEQTEVFNKSKAAVNTDNCKIYEQREIKTVNAQHGNQQLPVTATNQRTTTVNPSVVAKELIVADPKIRESHQTVPYYILYQSLRAYL